MIILFTFFVVFAIIYKVFSATVENVAIDQREVFWNEI